MLSALCVSLVFIGLGLLMIFGRDFTWGLQEFSNQTRGVQSERTETWDSMQIFSGIIVVIVGIVLSIMIFGRNLEEQQQIASGTATAQAHLAEVEQYGTPIATLQNVSTGTFNEIDAKRLGLDASRIYYGRCASGDFYAYIFDPTYDYKALAYVPSSSPDYCHPNGIYLTQVTKIGNGWYELWASDSPRTIQTTVWRMLATELPLTPTLTASPAPVATVTPEATP